MILLNKYLRYMVFFFFGLAAQLSSDAPCPLLGVQIFVLGPFFSQRDVYEFDFLNR